MNWNRPLLLITLFLILAYDVNDKPKQLSQNVSPKLEKLAYNNPGLTVNLGVGLWASPLPVDYVDGKPRFLELGKEFLDFKSSFSTKEMPLFPGDTFSKLHNNIRFNQWKYGDYENDGDLDIICGEFLDKFTYFENIGSREKPVYAKDKYLKNDSGILTMDLEMILPVSIDWDKAGKPDLLIGAEDGYFYYYKND